MARSLTHFRADYLAGGTARKRTARRRLIRDIDDRGVLVICDNRLVMRPYGAVFLASLPP
jgi:hypothetical protein